METHILLEKTRVMHQLLQKASSFVLQFDNIATELKSVLDCNVYIIDKEGELLGQAEAYDLNLFSLEDLEGKQFSKECMHWFTSFNKSEVNIEKEESKVIITPVLSSGEKVGTVIYARKEKFTPLEVILAEYGSSVTGMQIMRAINIKLENEARKKGVVQLALEVLSYSELEAVKYIFNEIEGTEGFLVASKLAERYKLTRSVIVNALRKLESAGVIDARSLGMKGTYIKVLNDYLYNELAEV